MKVKSLVRSVRLAGAFCGALASVAIVNAADYPTTVLSFNPVAYYRFSETAPVPLANVISNWGSLGATGNGYVVLDATNGNPGIVGNCIQFNNPGPNIGTCGSKVDVTYNPALNPSGAFSIEFWANPSSTNSDGAGVCPVCSMNPDTTVDANNRSGFLVYARGAPNNWQFRIGSQHNSYVKTLSGGNWSVGAWSHVVGVYDGAGNVSLYVNGVLVGGPVAVNAPFEPNRFRNFRIGGSNFGGNLGSAAGNRGWDGFIEQVAMYNTALSASTVKAHFDCVTTNNAGYKTLVLASNPVGYWPMGESVYTAPNPNTFPMTANAGTGGAILNGTNAPGVTAGTAGPPFSGMGAGNKSSTLSGIVGEVDITNADALNFTGPITMIAWCKAYQVDSSPVLRDIIAHGFSDQEVFFRLNSGFYEVGSWNGSTTFNTFAQQPSVDANQWVFLAGTYDGANWNLYRYDKLMASTAQPSGALTVNTNWAIGAGADLSPVDGRFWGGAIGEVAIFTNALSLAQLQSIMYSAQVPPLLLQKPSDQVPPSPIYEGPTLQFSVWAEGNATLSYLWTKNGTSLGITTTNLTLANITTNTSGTYAVIVTNPVGSVTNSFVLNVLTGPPLVTQQTTPASATRFAGASIPFSVAAIGSPTITYQWKFNATNSIGGATSSAYTLANVQAANAGNYSCTITNPYGTTNTLSAPVSVLAAPTQPFPAGVLADNPAWFWRLGETSGSVAHDYWGGVNGTYNNVTLAVPGYSFLDPDKAVGLSGAANSYVGQIDGTVVDFSAPNPEFTIEAWVNGPAGQVDGAAIVAKGVGGGSEQFDLDIFGGVYRFFVRDLHGNVMPGGTLLASDGPNGTWQHVVGTYSQSGNAIALYVNGVQEATGTPSTNQLLTTSHPVSIGARRSTVDPSYDFAFNGSIDEVAIYKHALSSAQVLAHYCNQFGNSQAPFVGVQPANTINWIGWPADLKVVAAGSCTLSYQWFKGVNPVADDPGHITGSSSDHLSFFTLQAGDAGSYYCHIANTLGNTNSANAVITVIGTPTNSYPIPNLVMHLTFDTNLTDITGRGNNGTGQHHTKTGTTAATPANNSSGNQFFYYTDGRLGGALHYSTDGGPLGSQSGAGTNDWYVTLGVRPDLQFGTSQDFSVSFWIRMPLNYDQGDLPFFCNAPTSTGGQGFTFAPSYGTNAMFASSPPSGTWGWSINGARTAGADYLLNDAQWHHLVHTFQRNGNGITYVDGVKVNELSIVGAGNISNPTNAATIGQDPTGFYPETGSMDIDDLGVWTRALTELEARGLYVAGTNNVSFTDITPLIKTGPGAGQITISWQAGTLQSADAVTGPYADVPSAVSPMTVNLTPSTPKKFYRVRYPQWN